MNIRISVLPMLVWPAVAAAATMPSRVEVVYVDPSKFADVRNGYTQTPSAREFYLGEIRRYIEQSAARHLADDDVLEVTITDVHLAGDYLARHPVSTNVRVVREVTPARIDLSFRLSRNGAVTREGRRELRSTGYPISIADPTDALNYEKALIDRWLSDDLPPQR